MQHSRALTRKSASNLALAFVLLPREKRDAMSALYAFCRAVDDVADEDSVPVEKRREQLAAWREDIRRTCENKTPEFVLNQEFQPVIQRFQLPFSLLDELINGCEMDLEVQRHADYGSLELYCYRVASVVGLLSIEVFGYQNPACHDYGGPELLRDAAFAAWAGTRPLLMLEHDAEILPPWAPLSNWTFVKNRQIGNTTLSFARTSEDGAAG